MVHMTIVSKEKLCNMINKAIEDELVGFVEYEEILESIPKELNGDFYGPIAKIMEDEATHAVMFRRMGLELGCSEPKLTQKLEKLLKIAGSDTEKEMVKAVHKGDSNGYYI